MGLGFSGADIMSLPPDMLRTIMQLLQSGQWGTPQGFEQLLGGPNMTGQGAQIAGRKNWMYDHPQFDPFGWEEFTKGTDFDPYSKPRAMTPEEIGGGAKSNIEGFSRDLTPQEIAQIKAIKQDPKNWNLTGQALIDKLPSRFNTPEYQKLAAAYPDLAHSYGNQSFFDWPGIAGPNDVMTTPPSRDQAQFNAASALGYGGKSLLQRGKGEHGINDVINTANALQTLKSAGWDKSMGYGPQEGLSDKMNQLLFAVAPDYDKSKIPVPEKDPRLSQVYDPFGGMQSAMNRDAYVNETLGGGFYGGVIPEEKDQRFGIFEHGGMGHGEMSDPHFPIMQRGPDGKPMYSPGWASNQAQQFGSLPYEMFGQQVNDINNPRGQQMGAFAGNMTANTAPPTWNGGNPTPWPMSGNNNGGNVWGAPWGGNRQSTPSLSPASGAQPQGVNGPSYNPDPWSNPWNMK